MFKNTLLILIASLLIFSCNKDNIDYKGAISAFSTDFTPKIDPKLAEKPIKLPKQIKNLHFTNFHTDKIANFALNSKIKKVKNINNGYVTSGSYNFISKPIIYDNIIYSLDARGNLSAINLKNNKLIYRKRIIKWYNIKNLSQGKISYDNNIIYVTTGFNKILAVHAKNADKIWEKELSSIAISKPIIHQNLLYLISNDNKSYALDKKTGEIKWIHNSIVRNTAIFGAANPIIYKNYLISSYSSGEIYILDHQNGNVINSYQLSANRAIDSNFILDDIDATPIIKNNILYAIGNGGLMIAINLNNWEKIWQKNMSSISNFWIIDDFIYVIDNENRLICLDSNYGTIKFFKKLDKYYSENKLIHYHGLILAGDNLILSNSNKEILLLSPFDGNIRQKIKFSKHIQQRPIIANKRLYIYLKGRFNTSLAIFE